MLRSEYKKMVSEGKLNYKNRLLRYKEIEKADKIIVCIGVYENNKKINEVEAYKRYDLVNEKMLKELDLLIQ